MIIMNLIHDICLTKTNLKNTPKWKFITIRKLNKKLNEDIDKFMDLDIFSIGDNVLTFLLSLDKKCIDKIDCYIHYGSKFISVIVTDDEVLISYFPKSNYFEISAKNMTFTIYRNTKASKYFTKIWEPLMLKTKERYLEIIIQMADYISKY